MSRIATLVISIVVLAGPAGSASAEPSRRVLLVGAEARGPAKRVGRAAEARIVAALEAATLARKPAQALRRCKGKPRTSCLQAAARRASSQLVLTSAVRKQGKRFLLDLRLYSVQTGEEVGSVQVTEKQAGLPVKGAEAAKRLVFNAQLRRVAVATPAPEKTTSVARAQAADGEDPR